MFFWRLAHVEGLCIKARKADIQMIDFKDRMIGAWHMAQVFLFSSFAIGS